MASHSKYASLHLKYKHISDFLGCKLTLMNILLCSVMAVKFVRCTHYVFSVGKDRLVKYWDADKFELLLTLEGHHAEVWCLTISNRGDFLVTGSHDRSIRRWDRTEEPFFLEVFLCGT